MYVKDDYGKICGDMNVILWIDVFKFKFGGIFVLIVLKSCGYFKVGEKYYNLVWVENKYVWNFLGVRFVRWLFFLFVLCLFCLSIIFFCKVNKKNL